MSREAGGDAGMAPSANIPGHLRRRAVRDREVARATLRLAEGNRALAAAELRRGQEEQGRRDGWEGAPAAPAPEAAAVQVATGVGDGLDRGQRRDLEVARAALEAADGDRTRAVAYLRQEARQLDERAARAGEPDAVALAMGAARRWRAARLLVAGGEVAW